MCHSCRVMFSGLHWPNVRRYVAIFANNRHDLCRGEVYDYSMWSVVTVLAMSRLVCIWEVCLHIHNLLGTLVVPEISFKNISKGSHQQNSREIDLSDLGWPHH